MTVLFVGDNSERPFLTAQLYDSSTRLIDSKTILEIHNIPTGHISLCDLPIEDFKYALEQADELYYVPISETEKELKQRTELWLRYQSHRKPVHNLPNGAELPMLAVIDTRKTTDSQLWVAGCSYTYGFGVSEHERWGNVLASMLNLPVSTLAYPGSSIRWAADQILRSDIKAGDTVVWGVTGVSRFPYYNNKVNHISQSYYRQIDTRRHPDFKFNSLINQKILVSDHLLYEALISIDQVIRYCSLIGCKLLLSHFYLDVNYHEISILDYLTRFDFYVDFSSPTLIDFGSDNLHPGVNQHKLYAETFYKFLTSQ